MPGFNPDQYLEEKTGGSAAPTGFDPDRYLSQKTGLATGEATNPIEQGTEGLLNFLQKGTVAGAAGQVLSAADKEVGAPFRKGVGAAQNLYRDYISNNPDASIMGAAKFIGNKMMEPGAGPSASDIGNRADLPKLSPSGLLPNAYSDKPQGLQLKKGGVFDPSLRDTVLGAATSPAALAGTLLAEKVPVGDAVQAVKEAPEAIKDLAGGATDTIKNLGKKYLATTSGATEKQVSTLFRKTDEVLDLAKKYNNDIAAATDAKRVQWNDKIAKARQGLNEQITNTIENSYPDKVVDINPVIDSLEVQKAKLHPQYDADEISQISDLQKKIVDSGDHSVGDAYKLKQTLQDIASGAYKKDGQIFMPGKTFQRAAKNAAVEANNVIEANAPELRGMDTKLSQLRKIEGKLNKSVLAEGKSNAAILSAGAGGNGFQRGLLQKLGNLTGAPILEDAEALSAADTFGNPRWVPNDMTGKAVSRQIFGGGLGTLAGGPVGGVVGGLLSSPAAAKAMIRGASGLNSLRKGLLK